MTSKSIQHLEQTEKDLVNLSLDSQVSDDSDGDSKRGNNKKGNSRSKDKELSSEEAKSNPSKTSRLGGNNDETPMRQGEIRLVFDFMRRVKISFLFHISSFSSS